MYYYIIGWIVVGLIYIISFYLIQGKGSFLIAGFNTSNKLQKEQYNVERLCRVNGSGMFAIATIMSISLYFKFDYPHPILELMVPWGLFIVLGLMIVLANTICKRK